MDVPSDPDTSGFSDLLESAGLKQSVTGPTHRCGHTLDLVIDRQEDSMLSPLFESDHITPVLQKLHWLPVKSRIIYKILLLIYKALNGLAPSYLSELLDTYRPSRNLRSSGKLFLTTKKTNTVNYGDRAFSVCAPKLWNNLPLHIRQAKSLSSFKSQLKTHLFKNS